MLLFDMLRIKTSIKNTPKRLKLKENFILMFGAFFIETDEEEPGRRDISFGGPGGPGGNVGQMGTNTGNFKVHLGRR